MGLLACLELRAQVAETCLAAFGHGATVASGGAGPGGSVRRAAPLSGWTSRKVHASRTVGNTLNLEHSSFLPHHPLPICAFCFASCRTTIADLSLVQSLQTLTLGSLSRITSLPPIRSLAVLFRYPCRPRILRLFIACRIVAPLREASIPRQQLVLPLVFRAPTDRQTDGLSPVVCFSPILILGDTSPHLIPTRRIDD